MTTITALEHIQSLCLEARTLRVRRVQTAAHVARIAEIETEISHRRIHGAAREMVDAVATLGHGRAFLQASRTFDLSESQETEMLAQVERFARAMACAA